MKGVDGKEGNESECWKDKAYMWCQVSMGQVEDFKKIHVVFAERELVTTQSYP